MNKNISTILAILIVIAAAVILVGGVFAYQYWWAPQAENKPPESTFNTYKNTKAGIELKYPESWEIVYERFDYQTAACQANPTANCVKKLQVGLGKSKEKSLLDINMRQCLNDVVNLSAGNYICFDSALGNEKGTINLLDNETKNAINTIKTTFAIDETAGWKTYRNEEYGFEMKYPNNYYIGVSGRREEGGLVYQLLTVAVDEEPINDYKTSLVAIDVAGPNFILGTRDWQDFTLGEIDGSISYTWKAGKKVLAEVIFTSKNNQRFYIKTKNDPMEDGITAQILSTFKFLE